MYKKGRTHSDLIFKFGKIDKIPWKDLISNASDDALDLLDKMLKFDPDKRITIEQAMKHKYFDDLPVEVDEKVESVSKFDFEFEELDLSTSELRDLILLEIMLYHDQKILDDYEKAREQYNKGEKKKKDATMSKSNSKNKK